MKIESMLHVRPLQFHRGPDDHQAAHPYMTCAFHMCHVATRQEGACAISVLAWSGFIATMPLLRLVGVATAQVRQRRRWRRRARCCTSAACTARATVPLLHFRRTCARPCAPAWNTTSWTPARPPALAPPLRARHGHSSGCRRPRRRYAPGQMRQQKQSSLCLGSAVSARKLPSAVLHSRAWNAFKGTANPVREGYTGLGWLSHALQLSGALACRLGRRAISLCR